MTRSFAARCWRLSYNNQHLILGNPQLVSVLQQERKGANIRAGLEVI
jgi:hypothetical protein